MIHRLAGLLVLALVLAVALVAARRAAAEGRRLAQGAALLSPVLTAAQVLAGVLLVRSGIGLAEAVAHTGLAALLLAALTVAYLALGPQVTRIAYRGADVRPLRSTLAVPAR
jgi:heme A synthase